MPLQDVDPRFGVEASQRSQQAAHEVEAFLAADLCAGRTKLGEQRRWTIQRCDQYRPTRVGGGHLPGGFERRRQPRVRRDRSGIDLTQAARRGNHLRRPGAGVAGNASPRRLQLHRARHGADRGLQPQPPTQLRNVLAQARRVANHLGDRDRFDLGGSRQHERREQRRVRLADIARQVLHALAPHCPCHLLHRIAHFRLLKRASAG